MDGEPSSIDESGAHHFLFLERPLKLAGVWEVVAEVLKLAVWVVDVDSSTGSRRVLQSNAMVIRSKNPQLPRLEPPVFVGRIRGYGRPEARMSRVLLEVGLPKVAICYCAGKG